MTAEIISVGTELLLGNILNTNAQYLSRELAALGITVFGRPRVMTSEHCILQVANGCIHDCASCRLRARKLSLKNIDGKVMPVRTDIHGRSRL